VLGKFVIGQVVGITCPRDDCPRVDSSEIWPNTIMHK